MTDVASEPAAAVTAGEALRAATEMLRAAGSPTPRLDAELLVAHALDRDRTWLLAHGEAVVTRDVARTLEGALARRARGEPVAYIRGWKEWLSMRVATDARAMIPRPETELLALAAVGAVSDRLTGQRDRVGVWDVGTGSGALALALARRFDVALRLGRVRVFASDSSEGALELAAHNLAAHGVADGVTLVCCDLLETAGESLPLPDVVVANLPYIATDAVDAGAGSLAHEPRQALDGGEDGLDVVRRLLSVIPVRTAPGATVLLEIGAGQADAVTAMVEPGASVLTLRDLAGVERVVQIDRP